MAVRDKTFRQNFDMIFDTADDRIVIFIDLNDVQRNSSYISAGL